MNQFFLGRYQRSMMELFAEVISGYRGYNFRHLPSISSLLTDKTFRIPFIWHSLSNMFALIKVKKYIVNEVGQQPGN